MSRQLQNAALGPFDLLDETAKLGNDFVDRLLVETHLLEGLDHLLTVCVDLRFDPLLARRRACLEAFVEFLRDLVEMLHLVNQAKNPAIGLLFVELGVVVLRVADDVLYPDLVLPELVAQVHDLAHGNRRVENCRQNGVLALLDALGNLDFPLAREKRDAPHLAQVHPNGVVAL